MTEKILFMLMAVAFSHFIYRTIILTVLQMILHYKLLSLRNSLEEIKASNSDNVFNLVSMNLEWATNGFRDFTLTRLYLKKRFSEPNENMVRLIEQRDHEIRESDPRLRKIVSKLDRYLMSALFMNSFGLLLWLSPAVIFVFIQNGFSKFWPDKIRVAVRSFVFIPTEVY